MTTSLRNCTFSTASWSRSRCTSAYVRSRGAAGSSPREGMANTGATSLKPTDRVRHPSHVRARRSQTSGRRSVAPSLVQRQNTPDFVPSEPVARAVRGSRTSSRVAKRHEWPCADPRHRPRESTRRRRAARVAASESTGRSRHKWVYRRSPSSSACHRCCAPRRAGGQPTLTVDDVRIDCSSGVGRKPAAMSASARSNSWRSNSSRLEFVAARAVDDRREHDRLALMRGRRQADLDVKDGAVLPQRPRRSRNGPPWPGWSAQYRARSSREPPVRQRPRHERVDAPPVRVPGRVAEHRVQRRVGKDDAPAAVDDDDAAGHGRHGELHQLLVIHPVRANHSRRVGTLSICGPRFRSASEWAESDASPAHASATLNPSQR